LSAALVLAVIFGLVASGTFSAVFAAPPPKEQCTGDVYERLECKQKGLVKQLEYMVDDNLTSDRPIGEALSASKKKALRSAKTKAQVIKGHVTKDNFKKTVKSIRKNNKKSCYLVPLNDSADDGYPKGIADDGICDWEQGDKTAECAAEEDRELDCDPKLKRPHPNRRVCAQICETEAAETDMDEEEQELAQELEESYDAMEDSLIETNEVLEEVNTILENEAVKVRVAINDPCANIAELPEGLEESVSYLRGAAAATADIHDGVAAYTRQTIVAVAVAFGFGGGGGGNSSAAGVVTAVIKGVAEMAYVVVDEIVSNRQAEIQKNTFACLQEAVQDIAAVEGKVDANAMMLLNEIMAARTALSEQIELMREEIVRLLCTPPGRRPEFPNP
jgi:hypothetical protein